MAIGLLNMPDEILLRIFKELGVEFFQQRIGLYGATRLAVCKQWYRVALTLVRGGDPLYPLVLSPRRINKLWANRLPLGHTGGIRESPRLGHYTQNKLQYAADLAHDVTSMVIDLRADWDASYLSAYWPPGNWWAIELFSNHLLAHCKNLQSLRVGKWTGSAVGSCEDNKWHAHLTAGDMAKQTIGKIRHTHAHDSRSTVQLSAP